MAAHGLRKLRVASVDGALFGTLADDVEPPEDYLGAPVLAQLRRLFERPVTILGYIRQRIRANWKLYAENTRDNSAGAKIAGGASGHHVDGQACLPDTRLDRVSAFLLQVAPGAKIDEVRFALGQLPGVRIVEGNTVLTQLWGCDELLVPAGIMIVGCVERLMQVADEVQPETRAPGAARTHPWAGC
jgi:hypothetical protein